VFQLIRGLKSYTIVYMLNTWSFKIFTSLKQNLELLRNSNWDGMRSSRNSLKTLTNIN